MDVDNNWKPVCDFVSLYRICSEKYFDVLNRLGVAHKYDGLTDGRIVR